MSFKACKSFYLLGFINFTSCIKLSTMETSLTWLLTPDFENFPPDLAFAFATIFLNAVTHRSFQVCKFKWHLVTKIIYSLSVLPYAPEIIATFTVSCDDVCRLQ